MNNVTIFFFFNFFYFFKFYFIFKLYIIVLVLPNMGECHVSGFWNQGGFQDKRDPIGVSGTAPTWQSWTEKEGLKLILR